VRLNLAPALTQRCESHFSMGCETEWTVPGNYQNPAFLSA
jgi:hypothetical protein